MVAGRNLGPEFTHTLGMGDTIVWNSGTQTRWGLIHEDRSQVYGGSGYYNCFYAICLVKFWRRLVRLSERGENDVARSA